jgi:hypothetical protein
MSTQLRLVETPGTPGPTGAKGSATPRRGRITSSGSAPGRGRRVRWDADWRLSANRRRIGLEGVAAARAALAQADRPSELRPAEELSEAS